MKHAIRLDPDAEEEFKAAVAWYEEQRPGLGDDFVESVSDAIGRIRESPGVGSPFPGVSENLGVRRVLVQRFPYSVVYMELTGHLRILALAHSGRKPGYWRTPL